MTHRAATVAGASPARRATALAGGYFALTAAYIVASDWAASSTTLFEVGLAKGVAFAAVTAALLGLVACRVLRSMARARVDLREAQDALARAEQRTTPGLLAASVAHDVNNLLAVLTSGLYELETRPSDAERDAIVGDMKVALRRGSELVRRLSRVGRAPDEPAEVDVAAIAAEAVELGRHHPAARGRSIELASQPVRALVQPARVHQLVTNLLVNALEASPPGGHARVVVAPAGDAVALEVHDDGPGIPERLREAIFDPFFTTKLDGTGLGMLSVRVCAELHGGHVEVGRSAELGGARIRVVLRGARELEPAR